MTSVLVVCRDAFMRFLLPTSTPSYKKKRGIIYSGSLPGAPSKKLDELQSEVQPLKDIVKFAQLKREAALGRLQADISHPTAPAATAGTPSQDALLKEYCANIEAVRLLSSHLEMLENSIRDFNYVVDTQATADLTGYRGLRHWAKKLQPALNQLTNAILAVSSIGTGLVYATIFSASRGNITYMAVTFPLFSVGIIVPVIIQVGLRWASALPHEIEFASQPFWTGAIAFFLLFATLCVMAAISLLNLTVYWLSFEAATASVETSSGAAAGIAGIVTFALPGLIFVFLLGGFSLGVARNGLKALRPTAGRHSDHIWEGADDFKHI